MSTKKRNKHTVHSSPQSVADHLGELRARLTWLVVIFVAASTVAYILRDLLVALVLAPIGDQKLVYLTPGGGFSFIFQIIIYVGLLLTTPFIIYHIYRFIAPALPESVRGRSGRIIIASTLLMAFGACFGYFVAVPAALLFLEGFASEFVQANLTAESYFSFLVAYVLGLGLLFQLPLLLVLWNWISPLKPGGLLDTQRYVVVGSFVAAALITPTPDVFNQVMVAAPIILIYQLGVISVYMMNRKQRAPTVATRPVAVERELGDEFPEQIFSAVTLAPPDQTAPAAQPEPVSSRVATGPKAISIDGFKPMAPGSRQLQTIMRAQPIKLTPPARRMTSARRQVSSHSTSIDGFSFV